MYFFFFFDDVSSNDIFFFFQAEDGIRDYKVTGVQTCALPISFAEQHAVADHDVDGDQLAGLVTAAGPDGNDFALRRLFLGGVRDDDTAGRFLLGIDALDDDAVMKRTKLHTILLSDCNSCLFPMGPARERCRM